MSNQPGFVRKCSGGLGRWRAARSVLESQPREAESRRAHQEVAAGGVAKPPSQKLRFQCDRAGSLLPSCLGSIRTGLCAARLAARRSSTASLRKLRSKDPGTAAASATATATMVVDFGLGPTMSGGLWHDVPLRIP